MPHTEIKINRPMPESIKKALKEKEDKWKEQLKKAKERHGKS